jgi:hypothetical protein
MVGELTGAEFRAVLFVLQPPRIRDRPCRAAAADPARRYIGEGQLQDKVSSGVLREELDGLYKRLCEVLHGRRTVTGHEARTAFRETLEIIERLYEQQVL